MTKMIKKITRREFLWNASLAAVATGLNIDHGQTPVGDAKALVVRVHDHRASRAWDFMQSAPWDHTVEPRSPEEMRSERFRKDRYYDLINEDAVSSMFRRGLRELTGAANARDAWGALLKGYKQGHRITVKVNLNNASYSEQVTTNRLDQTAPLINAIISTLVEEFSVAEESITVADPSRLIRPDIIRRRCRFAGIRWIDSRSRDLWDEKATVAFTRDKPVRPDRPGMPEKASFALARVYTETDHLINVCLLKNHGCGITGAMKNHFGAIEPPSPKFLHDGLGEKSYIADLSNSPHIRSKLRLNVCDAVFANWHDNVWSPRPWKTFPGGTPNSLFLGTDPVAFDSVLLQHIRDEVVAQGDHAPAWVREAVDKHDFLHYAMEFHGLGIHEHGPFKKIRYREIENA